MSAPGDDRASPGAERRYGLTFGTDHTQTAWTDRRHLSWPELARLLTTHRVGPKSGPCVVPALLRGGRRRQDETEQIDVAMLDADAGHTLAEIAAALTARGWRAAIHSTHSHLTRRTRVKATHFDRWLAEHPNRDAADYLIAVRHMLPRVADGARLIQRVVEHDGERDVEFCILEHAPCPKFRVAVPLARPWRAADYPDQAAANAAWRERIAALAHALGLQHDQSCTDTSRLFFLPRRPEGTRPESRVLDGVACDLWGLPPAPEPAAQPESEARMLSDNHPDRRRQPSWPAAPVGGRA